MSGHPHAVCIADRKPCELPCCLAKPDAGLAARYEALRSAATDLVNAMNNRDLWQAFEKIEKALEALR